VPGDFSIESGVAAVETLFNQDLPPTAIFCFSDKMAIGVVEGARRRGIRLPTELSIVGFDDIHFALYTNPPLTTIAQPMRAIGEGTVHLLLRILGDDSVAPASQTLPHRLIVRDSTAPPPR
jgi:LacI family repressor for deo operon, udp, cdd, tsx, nupC, and nupG